MKQGFQQEYVNFLQQTKVKISKYGTYKKVQ